ncbi:MAG: glycosyltransferase [bacterium]|nr:glycosyltransferase [bacterium]
MADPLISIIVPSRGRVEHLTRLLDCLSRQDIGPGESFEVLVGLDGCTEQERAALPGDYPFPLEYLPLPQVGISAAKNAAAAHARGRIYLLLNDDVEPVPGFVRAHAAAQAAGHAMVLGSSPWHKWDDQTVFDEMIARTRMIFFYAELRAGESYDFRHAWNLNLSVRRDGLDRPTAPFEEVLRPCWYDDVEMAYRMIGDQPRVFYHPVARAPHRHRYDLRGYFERESILGAMAGQLCAVNPECFRAVFSQSFADVLDHARRGLDLDVRDQQRCLRLLSFWAARPWHDLAGCEDAGGVLDVLYGLHLPLKRRAFRVGLLAAEQQPDRPWPQRGALAEEALRGDVVLSRLDTCELDEPPTAGRSEDVGCILMHQNAGE